MMLNIAAQKIGTIPSEWLKKYCLSFTPNGKIECGLSPHELPVKKKGTYTMIITYSITENQKPTPEQIQRIKEAAKRPVVYDDDCPEISDEQLSRFRKVTSFCEETDVLERSV